MFLFGGKKNETKKIEGGFEEKIKTTMKGKLCPVCGKNPSSKVAFGHDVQPSLTCNNCELKAVGGVTQKLGTMNLISNQKFANLLTNQMIAYQKAYTQPPVVQKQNHNLALTLDKQVKEAMTSIKAQFHSLKEVSKTKMSELSVEAQKQNVTPIFDQTLKFYSEKKSVGADFMQEALKRSLVGAKGVHFIDQQQLESCNVALDKRLQILRTQTKIKLKSVKSLISDIDNIKFD